MWVVKTNTACTIPIGPLVDYEDGTPETSLTVTAITCELFKMPNDGGVITRTAITLSASGGDNDMVHITDDVAGMYSLELTAAQTNFLGRARLALTDADAIMSYFVDLLFVTENVFNWLVGADNLDVAVIEQANIDFGALQKASINTEVDTALSDINLDHLAKTPTVAEDMTTEVADGTILGRILGSLGDTSKYDSSYDSLYAQSIRGSSIQGIVGKLEKTTEADGLLFRFTTRALVNAPKDMTSVGTVTSPVTTTSDTQIDNIEADTNELQGLISSGKLPAQVKGMDADTLTASALATDAVTEITNAIVATGAVGGGKWVNEGETSIGNVYLKHTASVDLYIGLYKDSSEPPETATLATITEVTVAFGYARIKLESADWTEGTVKGEFTNVIKTFTASGGDFGTVTGYFICTASSGTSGKLLTVEHFNTPHVITDGLSEQITPTLIIA